MTNKAAELRVVVGPNEGDALRVEEGGCRLVGRHVSELETVFIDRDGNRMLDPTTTELFGEQVRAAAPAAAQTGGAAAFVRGPDVILADDSISRAHAMLFVQDGQMGIIDLASTNGTFVNNVRIGSAMLAPGDVLALGMSQLTLAGRKRRS